MSVQSEQPNRVLLPGVFDLLNVGHLKYIEQAKHIYYNTTLIIGMLEQQSIESQIGLTVMSLHERTENIKHVRGVDEVISCPWPITPSFLETNKIDIVIDSQFEENTNVYNRLFDQIEKIGKLRKVKRMQVPKNSEYIRRVLYCLDDYVIRSLDRGFNSKDLGISSWKILFLKTKEKLKKSIFRCRIRKSPN